MQPIFKLLIITLFFSQINFAQSKLKKAKSNLSDNSFTSNTSTTSNSSSSSSSKNTFLVDLLIEPIIWIGTHTVLGEAEDRSIVPFPYYNGYQGEYSTNYKQENYKNSLLHINSYYISSKDAVKGLNIDVNYRFTPLIGAELKHLHLFEKYFGETEYLDISSLLFNYYRIREKYVTAYWGIGLSYIANEVKKVGFSYATGIEIFPVNPISLSFTWQQNFVNAQAINELKLQLNYHIKQFSPFIGYYNYNLAGVKNPSIGFGCNYRF
ncbi:hypothetical protein [Pseudofulvibacter geojedonensis]|uniref:Outer membrane protein beta-barrel domain-containing protein n=1 Tax=Pseudofulvibacter geojedonensis TaxID=1123758 RepID=A0ABW3I4B2_9FLAO